MDTAKDNNVIIMSSITKTCTNSIVMYENIC